MGARGSHDLAASERGLSLFGLSCLSLLRFFPSPSRVYLSWVLGTPLSSAPGAGTLEF
jgi:hypothetical protein